MKQLRMFALSLSLASLVSTVPVVALSAPYDLSSPTATAKVMQPAELLFILRANHGVITHHDHSYKLTLTGMDTRVLFFSDRPVREAGQVSLPRFVKGWAQGSQSFKSNPPNAILLHQASPVDQTGFSKGIALVLSNPVANADGLTFDVKAVSGELTDGRYDKVALFIDAWQYTLPQNKKFGAPTIT